MKTPLFVDRGKLESAIRQAELNGPLSNRSKLWQVVADIYNKNKATDVKEITFSVVGLRIAEWKLVVKTPLGKRGRASMTPEERVKQVALMQAGRVGVSKVSKAEKFAKDPEAQAAIQMLRQVTPARFQPLVLKVIQGSRTAALKLNCLACANWQPVEVKKCPCNHCPVYLFRSYQNKPIKMDSEGNETLEDSIEESNED